MTIGVKIFHYQEEKKNTRGKYIYKMGFFLNFRLKNGLEIFYFLEAMSAF